jgi:hypothetical protein
MSKDFCCIKLALEKTARRPNIAAHLDGFDHYRQAE